MRYVMILLIAMSAASVAQTESMAAERRVAERVQDQEAARPPFRPARPAGPPAERPLEGQITPPQSTPDPQYSRKRVSVRGVSQALCILGRYGFEFENNCELEPVERCPAAMPVMSDGATYVCELECDSAYPDASGNCSCEVILTPETCRWQ